MSPDAPVSFWARCLYLFLALYFVLGVSLYFSKGRDKDFPPLFHWFLFNKVPDERGALQYTARILSSGGAAYETPLLFAEAEHLTKGARSNRARDTLRRLGRALADGNAAEAERLRPAFERAYLPGDTAYEVVLITYRPIERFSRGEIGSLAVLGTFKTAP